MEKKWVELWAAYPREAIVLMRLYRLNDPPPDRNPRRWLAMQIEDHRLLARAA